MSEPTDDKAHAIFLKVLSFSLTSLDLLPLPYLGLDQFRSTFEMLLDSEMEDHDDPHLRKRVEELCEALWEAVERAASITLRRAAADPQRRGARAKARSRKPVPA